MTPEQMHFFALELQEMEKQALLGTAIRGLGSLATRATRTAPAGAGMLSRFKAKISRGIGRGAQGTLNRLTRTTMGRSAAPKAAATMPEGPAKSAVVGSWRQALKNRPPPKYSAGAKIIDGVPVPTGAGGLEGAANAVGRNTVRAETAVRTNRRVHNALAEARKVDVSSVTGPTDATIRYFSAAFRGATRGGRLSRPGSLVSGLASGLADVA